MSFRMAGQLPFPQIRKKRVKIFCEESFWKENIFISLCISKALQNNIG